MAQLYPDLEPYRHGRLEVGDGNLVYWEECGNPTGKPAVVLHGGPGSGCTPAWRRFFDPARYRIVLFDQRNCGRSTPPASDPATDLSTNTTDHLLADIELLRAQLGIDRWLIFGGSWGSVLGVAYAQRHPERVSEIVLFSIAGGSRRDIDWITQEMGRLFPAEWARFRAGVPAADRDGRLVEAYHRLLNDPDPAVRAQAVRDWCEWEDAHVNVRPEHGRSSSYDDPEFGLGFTRLVTHYWANDCWLPDGVLLAQADRLAGIPGVLVHGRLDVSSPLDNAWLLHQAWPESELVVIDDAGHGTRDPGVADALITATDRFAGRR